MQAHPHVPLEPFHTSPGGKPRASSIRAHTAQAAARAGRQGQGSRAKLTPLPREADASLERFPGWQVPSAPEAAFNPEASHLQQGVPTRGWGGCRSARTPLQGAWDAWLFPLTRRRKGSLQPAKTRMPSS